MNAATGTDETAVAVLVIVLIVLFGCVAIGVALDWRRRYLDRQDRRWEIEDHDRNARREARRYTDDADVRWRR